MKIDAPMRDVPLPAAAGEIARYERMGFDGVWTFDTAHDPFFPLLQGALSTEGIDIGTNILVAFGRSPFSTALSAWDLQRASKGRLVLGLGTQVKAHVERRFSMPFEHPAARITEYMDCLRAIWSTFQTGERPAFEGRFYRFTLINDFFNAGPIDHPDIPIYLAGVNERMCQAAGEAADGFHVHPMHSPGYLRDVVKPALAQGALKRGREVESIVLHAPVFVVLGDSEAERAKMEREVRQQVAFYGSTPSYRRFLEYHDLGALGKELSQLMRSGEMAKMAARIPDALLDEVAISSTFSELPAKLAARYANGLVQRASLYHRVAADADEAEWVAFTAACKSNA